MTWKNVIAAFIAYTLATSAIVDALDMPHDQAVWIDTAAYVALVLSL